MKQRVKRPSAYPDLETYIRDQVRVTESGCWEWPTGSEKDYPEVCVKGERIRLHRLSYELFKGEIPEGCHVCHHCDNTRCVNPEHLFAGRQQSNMRDMMRKGRAVRSKLTREDVVKIKNLYRTGKHSLSSLAREFSVTKGTIRNLIQGKTWLGVGANLCAMVKKKREAGPAKLTMEQVVEIRGLLEAGVSQDEIAGRYGVSRRSVYAIREGETWGEK